MRNDQTINGPRLLKSFNYGPDLVLSCKDLGPVVTPYVTPHPLETRCGREPEGSVSVRVDIHEVDLKVDASSPQLNVVAYTGEDAMSGGPIVDGSQPA
jgi:hypothetical protein